MPIKLSEILKHATLTAADPVIRAGAGAVAGTQLRWVHSSEVLDIAPLLSGGELLLTGGDALVTASDARRAEYVRQLSERGVGALAVETGQRLASLPSSMIQAAETAGLPLIEFRKVVPFVGIMQAINSMLVSESVAHLRRADEASHAMAVELAHGSSLDQILAVLAGIIDATLELSSVSGVTLGNAGPGSAGTHPGDGTASQPAEGLESGTGSPAEPGRAADPGSAAKTGISGTLISIDVPVRGVPSARLLINVPADGDANLARVAGGRCVDILSLALLQRMPPGLKEVAGTALLRAVSSGSQPWRLQQLSPAAGILPSATVVAVVVRSSTSQQLRAAMDTILKRSAQQSASYVDNAELLALAALPFDGAAAARAGLVAALRELPVEAGTMTAVGPLAAGIEHAPWSLSEAKSALDLAVNGSLRSAARPASDTEGVVIDVENLAVERLAVQHLDQGARQDFVRQQVGPLLDHDARRNSQLLATLATWLDSGCNTAQAARELHVERQSMHHRLQRIFELCGGDPRGTGRLAALHLATRLAAL
ncbi:purine catabolism regulator [Arthrobacter sp. PvP102]|uniref:PucR family transcriptional regulator n=1 Tax=unclassified Arthrobacter TaxID=235627 RepID=UPI001AE39B9A|nr:MULTISPECIES: PucR family transcriptional regulator [unclassified Arthrobacter]MBP1233084.1 purine catabolism regulator [Arthrobacter sp. PvP103]MBP1238219.1 purine catabolism regulator [Arthrobacter sp. PvP102]